MGLGILHHLFHFLFCKATGGSDGNLLFLCCCHVLCRYIQYAVCINIKCNLYLRNPPWCKRHIECICKGHGNSKGTEDYHHCLQWPCKRGSGKDGEGCRGPCRG